MYIYNICIDKTCRRRSSGGRGPPSSATSPSSVSLLTYTLHPAPYTLHPTPYTRHRIPLTAPPPLPPASRAHADRERLRV